MTVVTDKQTPLAGELRDVNKWYGDRHVLTDVSLAVARGEIVALIGRSGSGKSTVLRVVAGLSKDHTGERTVAGSPALAFQEPRLFPWRDVRTNVVYGLNRSRLGKDEAMSRADKALADVGLADRATAWPSTLSGADRVLVLDEGRLVYTLTIDRPRPPAGETTAETGRYRADLLDKLGVRI
jgi:sulfonate transport system ATP-binding protein